MRQLVVTCTALAGLAAAPALAQSQPYPPPAQSPPSPAYAAPPTTYGTPAPTYGSTTVPPAPGYSGTMPAYRPPPTYAAPPPTNGTPAPTYWGATPPPSSSYSGTMPAYRPPAPDAPPPTTNGTYGNATPSPSPSYSGTTPGSLPPTAPAPPVVDYGSTDSRIGGRPGHEPGSGISYPVSPRASNIDRGDSPSLIAPTLPTPALGAKAGPADYLNAARYSLAAGRTGEAQQALEMAQTRLLDRSVPYRGTNTPSGNPAVSQITEALHAIAVGDRARAMQIIDATLPLASN